MARELNDQIAMEMVNNKKADVDDMIFGIIWAKTFRSEVYPNYLFFRAFFWIIQSCALKLLPLIFNSIYCSPGTV